MLPIAPVAFTLRPQTIGYVFLLLTLICLERFRQGHARALWFLPPLFVIWANAHGSFMFGLFVIGLYWVAGLVNFRAGGLIAEQLPQRQRVQLLLTFMVCLLALLITPYGSEIAANPFEMATAQPLNIANIQEWQPLSLGNPLGTSLLVRGRDISRPDHCAAPLQVGRPGDAGFRRLRHVRAFALRDDFRDFSGSDSRRHL